MLSVVLRPLRTTSDIGLRSRLSRHFGRPLLATAVRKKRTAAIYFASVPVAVDTYLFFV